MQSSKGPISPAHRKLASIDPDIGENIVLLLRVEGLVSPRRSPGVADELPVGP